MEIIFDLFENKKLLNHRFREYFTFENVDQKINLQSFLTDFPLRSFLFTIKYPHGNIVFGNSSKFSKLILTSNYLFFKLLRRQINYDENEKTNIENDTEDDNDIEEVSNDDHEKSEENTTDRFYYEKIKEELEYFVGLFKKLKLTICQEEIDTIEKELIEKYKNKKNIENKSCAQYNKNDSLLIIDTEEKFESLCLGDILTFEKKLNGNKTYLVLVTLDEFLKVKNCPMLDFMNFNLGLTLNRLDKFSDFFNTGKLDGIININNKSRLMNSLVLKHKFKKFIENTQTEYEIYRKDFINQILENRDLEQLIFKHGLNISKLQLQSNFSRINIQRFFFNNRKNNLLESCTCFIEPNSEFNIEVNIFNGVWFLLILDLAKLNINFIELKKRSYTLSNNYGGLLYIFNLKKNNEFEFISLNINKITPTLCYDIYSYGKQFKSINLNTKYVELRGKHYDLIFPKNEEIKIDSRFSLENRLLDIEDIIENYRGISNEKRSLNIVFGLFSDKTFNNSVHIKADGEYSLSYIKDYGIFCAMVEDEKCLINNNSTLLKDIVTICCKNFF